MSQPVIDTLQLCDALRKTGMEREQAEGLARALGNELGTHVAVQSDLESGFQGVRSDLGAEIQQVRSDLGSKMEQLRCDLELKIQAVDAKVDVLRAALMGRMDGLEGRMEGRMDGLDRKIDALNWKLTFMVGGFALLMSVLTVASGMGFFERTPSGPQPPSVMSAAPP
ncbi:MAG: hypothetical protein F4X36_08670 [Gammaproteobacteria bacterium]|nr:hypothetical protein [Gammaproteobacteria bacterium]